MIWGIRYHYLPEYEYVSRNQHGSRFKRVNQKKLNVARLSCKANNSKDLTELILLSHCLDIPVHYDFEDHVAYIEVISIDALKGIK